jgi:lysozyme family protein
MLLDYTPFTDRMISRYEGGYGWNKKDAGGPTNFGITCFDLAQHRGQKMTSMVAWAPIVQAMTRTEAEEIYKVKYAAAIRFDDMPAGPDVVMMDYGVNSGTSRPIRVARAICNLPGGAMDQALVDAIRKYDPHKFNDTMNAERLRFMHAIRGGSAWAEFGAGWGARVADLGTYATHLADGKPVGSAPPAPDLSHIVQPKATHVPKTAGKLTTGGVVSTPAAHFLGLTVGEIAALAGGVLAIGVGYEAWQANKAAAANALIHLPPGV